MKFLDRFLIKVSTVVGTDVRRIRRELYTTLILVVISTLPSIVLRNLTLLVLLAVPLLYLQRSSIGKYLTVMGRAGREAIYGGVLFLAYGVVMSVSMLMKRFRRYFPTMCRLLEVNIEKTGNPFLDLFLDIYRLYVKQLGTIPREVQDMYITELEKQISTHGKIFQSITTIAVLLGFSPCIIYVIQLFLGGFSPFTIYVIVFLGVVMGLIVSVLSYIHDYSLHETITISGRKIPIILIATGTGLVTYTVASLVFTIPIAVVLAGLAFSASFLMLAHTSRLLSKIRFGTLLMRLTHEKELRNKPIDRALHDVISELKLPHKLIEVLYRTYPFNVILIALQELSETAIENIFQFFRTVVTKIFTFHDAITSEVVTYSFFVTICCIAGTVLNTYFIAMFIRELVAYHVGSIVASTGMGYTIPLLSMTPSELEEMLNLLLIAIIIVNLVMVFMLARSYAGTYTASRLLLITCVLWIITLIALRIAYPGLVRIFVV